MAASQDALVWCHSAPVEIPDGVFEDHTDPRTLVRFSGPIREEWKTALATRGIKIEFWAPPFGACLTLPPDMRPGELRQFPFLAGAVDYSQELCRRVLEPHSEAQRAATGVPLDVVDVVTFGRDVTPGVEAQLRAMGIPILDVSSSKIRVRYSGDLAALRDLEGVKIVNHARGSVALEASGLAVALAVATPTADWLPDLDGRGEIVAVADTGLDQGTVSATLHRDFQGRIEALISWPINPSWGDIVTQPGGDDGPADKNTGHGTHVAGLAVGDGVTSGGAHRGVAPAAHLVFQALEQYCIVKPDHQGQVRTGYYLAGRPLDLRTLFQQARDQGARIHINSWGDPALGAYTDDCHECDLFLRENPDALILFAAGNDGADRNGDGRIDASSLYAPGSAKNVVTVGATEGPLANAGLRATWADFDPANQRYLAFSDRSDPVSGQADRIALFSSAGPTTDGRIKPDVCAPGTNIAGARSQMASGRGWGLADPLPYYMYDGGTSTATGLAGGLAAVVRQAWRQASGGNAPTGAALKALLILGCQPVRGRASFAQALPMEAGYGRLSGTASIPAQPGKTILLFGDSDAGLQTGDHRDYPLTLPTGAAVRAVLCWYDAPGDRLINALDLALIGPNGNIAVIAADRTNNVQVLQLRNSAAGPYVLRVTGFNVPASPQAFALAVGTNLLL